MASHSRPGSASGISSPTASVPRQIHDFQLGDSLGKGAFGQVYRALNWATGETVAVKEIQLSNIPKGDIGDIMSEIDLLKNLNHPNIVKYKGFVKTREYLYIILEFCENGSLHNICKRFGKFPESLVAVYISQVLEGLVYLHDQGVIHRDIKGQNILTNKDGCVKLADFGVASTTAGALSDDAVVGSPYWMAPEVIEQSGATTASDIWSVGCTVIELLEGKPPYHFLAPMPALFRIVQDDCPPIPEGVSPIVKDFLYHCFQKDANLRVSAKKLLKHPWMASARKQLAAGKEQQKEKEKEKEKSKAGSGSGNEDETIKPGQPAKKRAPAGNNYNYDDAVAKVQEWNEALKSPARPSKNPTYKRRIPTHAPPSPLQAHSERASSSLLHSTSGGNIPNSLSAFKIHPSGLADKIREANVLQVPEEQDDNWDDDFEEGISFTKLHAVDKAAPEEKEDPGKTIRPTKSPGASTSSVPLPKVPPKDMSPIVEDYSDIAAEDDENWLEDKVSDFKMKNSFRRGLFHPDDIKTIGLGQAPAGPVSAPLVHKRSRPSLSTLIPPSSAGSGPPSARSSHSRSSSFVGSGSGSFGRADARRVQSPSEFDKYAEDDDDDNYEDVFGKATGPSADQPMQTLQLTTRLSNKSWLGDEHSDDDDPFAEIDEGFAEDDLETNLQRDKYARLSSQVNQLIDELTPSAPDFQLRDVCDQLLQIISDAPEMHEPLVVSHGMLAILEVLEGKHSRDVTLKLLQILNTLVTADDGVLESFCLIGGIPVMMGFTSKLHPSECRLEASHVIRLLCHTSVLTLQMFIACRGLKVLVDLLDEDYVEQSDLVIHALNGIGSVFELQSPTTKNDFCRMFIREGLLDPMSSALLNVVAGPEKASEIKIKIIHIILVFSQVSQSDIHVRNAMGTRKIIRRLLRACELLEPECLVHILKAIKHLSMSPTLLDVLQNANAIEILTKILDEQRTGPHSTEMANHIFQTCYNLCRLNKSRQEEAAQAGIIPSLRRVIETNSPLRQFALPILCDLAGAGKSCRTLLRQNGGLALYLKLLEDPYFQVSALEAILVWLQDETSRIEDELMVPSALESLLKCFVNAKSHSFENLLEPLLKMFRISSRITIGLASRAQFFQRVIARLKTHGRAVVRLNLLRLLKAACDAHPGRAGLVERYGLREVVSRLSEEDGAVLVRELAREILPALEPAIKVKISGEGPKLSASTGSSATPGTKMIAPKLKSRRTASEASILSSGNGSSTPKERDPRVLASYSSRKVVPSTMSSSASVRPRSSTTPKEVVHKDVPPEVRVRSPPPDALSKPAIILSKESRSPLPSRQRLGDISWQQGN